MAATTGGKKGKKKGKTISLNDFLGDSGASPGVVKPTLNWADEADEEFQMSFNSNPYPSSSSNKGKVIQLPTAPRSSRSIDIDTDRIPETGPFTAFVGNLPYDVDQFVLQQFFKDIPILNVRLPEENGRFKGFGYVQFNDRQSLIQALQMNEETFQKRIIRVDIADNNNREGGRSDRYGSTGGEDRTQGNWRKPSNNPPPSNTGQYSRSGGSYRNDDGGNKWGRSYDQNSRGYNDQRSGFSSSRENRYESSYDRPRQYESSRSNEPTRERPKLNLKPREKPLDTAAATTRSSSIFGAAKPVDTAARERMVEEKLLSHEKEIIENQVDKPVEPKKSVNIFGAAKPVDTSAREREMEGKIAEQEKLILQKVQTKPPTPTHTPSQASIFGNAKPVDTTAREREIEEKIRMQERDLIPDSSHPRNIRYQRSDRSDDGVTSPRRRSRTSSTRSEDAVEPHPSPNEAKKPQYKPAPAPKQSAWGGRDPSASHIRGTSAREEAKGKCKEKVVGRTPEGAEDNEIQASGNQPRYQSARNQLPREQTKVFGTAMCSVADQTFF
uniref:RRM domain-containing protein n=3 Tax=Ciona savignyi TaxID=51511 RepID=H2Y944_CIOSA